MSTVFQQAIDVRPGTKTYMRATVTTAERIEIPAEMQNRFCTFQAATTAVFIRFGDGTVDVDPTATGTSALASEVLTEDAASPHIHVPAGGSVDVRLPAGLFTHFAHESADTSGFLIFGASTGTGTDNDA